MASNFLSDRNLSRHPADKGKKVFDEEKKAVKELPKVQTVDVSVAPSETWRIDSRVDIESVTSKYRRSCCRGGSTIDFLPTACHVGSELTIARGAAQYA